MIVTTLSKVAARKFLTKEGLACETEDDLWYNVEILNCAATLRKTVVGEGGEMKGISENRLHDDIKICVDPKIPRSLGLEKFEENFVLSWAWDKEKILSPHEESNLRPSDSALQCSTTEPQRLYGERGLLRSSYDKRPAYCLDQQSLGLFANVIFLSQNFILTICIASPTWFLIKITFR